MFPMLQTALTFKGELLRTPGVQSFEEGRLRNDRQSYVALCRQVVQAQFVLRDRELANRLWQDVANRDMDLGRIINLLYRCSSPEDDEAMRWIDEGYLALIDRKDP
jgi:hypothetical protein